MKIYHNPKCSTSRKVLDHLREKGVDPEIVLYLKADLKTSDIREILDKGKMKATDILRKRDKVFKERFADKTLSDNEWIQAMLEHPSIIERPIVIGADKAVLCRPIQKVEEIFV